MLVHPVGPFHLKPFGHVALDPCFRILVLCMLAYKCCIHAISEFTSFQLVNSVHVNWETFLKSSDILYASMSLIIQKSLKSKQIWSSQEVGNMGIFCLSAMMWKHHLLCTCTITGLLWHLVILLSLCFSYSDKYECLLWNKPTEELYISRFKYYNPNLWFADSVKHSVTNFM